MDAFQQFIATSRYCRWLPEENRRESFPEAVDRYVDWLWDKVAPSGSDDYREQVRTSMNNLEVMGSMRALMTAGPAADRDNVCCFNCAYMPITDLESFKELTYILMCGTGVGYSVQHRDIENIPPVPDTILRSEETIVLVDDSKEGWANAVFELLDWLSRGIHPTWDVSQVRPAGARLNTFGGRASGPGPLEAVFKFIVSMFYERQGQQLSSLDCHDLACVIARSIIVGGVRRSAMISLSDLHDRDMAKCKSGAWWDGHGHRALANNSAIYLGRPGMSEFMSEWEDLYESRSGERGIYNIEAARKAAIECGRDPDAWYGLNPCAEILLLPYEFCNLSECVIRHDDTQLDIFRKVELAAILGTLQSALTHFPNLRPEWQKNCEEERLLGVSLTGIYDNKFMSTPSAELETFLKQLNQLVQDTNNKWAKEMGINPSKARCCVKPSGTVSCLVDSSSGIHPRYADYYIRRVRIDKKDPLHQLMVDQGVPSEDCVLNPDSTAVFSFPMKAPEGSVTTVDINPIDHLNLWLYYKQFFCDHNPSVTVNYTDDNFLEVGAWVYKNFDEVCGISFLPKVEHTYEQAPFEQITREQYYDFPTTDVDFSQLINYETEDHTKGSQELACTGGACEMVDIDANV